MSRRRSGRDGKHLERGAGLALLLQGRGESRGPCPGPCNAAYRRRLKQWEQEVLVEHDRLARAAGDDADLVELMEQAQRVVRRRWEAEDRGPQWPAREGAPVWCLRCTADIRTALDRIPRLLLLVLETGLSVPTRPDGSSVLDLVRVVSTSGIDEGGRVVDVLACGHRSTRYAVIGPQPSSRFCLTCVASASVPEPGRLPPPERVARRGARQPVSPAGSPAWLEADAAIAWACTAANLVDDALGTMEVDADGDGVQRWTWKQRHSTSDRVRVGVDAARWLLRHLEGALQLPGDLPEEVGRGALQVKQRLAAVSGESIQEHAVAGECPKCDRRGLVREDGARLVHCRSCGGHWDEDTIEVERDRKAQR